MIELDVEALWWILIIAFVGATALFLLNLFNDVEEDILYKQKVVSQDLALLLDAISASPDDVNVEYNFSRNYSINFSNEEDCFVSVLDDNEEKRTSDIATRSGCIKIKDGFERYSFKNPKRLIFKKEGGKLEIISA